MSGSHIADAIEQLRCAEINCDNIRVAGPVYIDVVKVQLAEALKLLLSIETSKPLPHPEVTMQMLIDAGINAFALKLLSESLAGKKDIKTFRAIGFTFRGVIYTLEPSTPADHPAPEGGAA